MKKINLVFLIVVFLCSCSGGSSRSDMTLVAEFEGGRLYKAGAVSVLQLNGTHYQMGRQYGMLLKDDLSGIYERLIAVFIPHFTYSRLKQIADAVYAVYPQKYKDIIVGMAETSGLGIEKQIILNAIEFFPKINAFVPSNCSGIGVWGDYTEGAHLLFGRNNDDAPLFKAFGGYTIVAVYNPTDSGIPAAVVNYAGAIYPPSGMNSRGIFLELNAGNWQGYFIDRPSIFMSLFSFLQNCATQDEMNTAFQSVHANISSIVNVADSNIAYSFECSTTAAGAKRRPPDAPGLLVSTNHFVDPSWGLPPPDPDEGWTVKRRNNLIALANAGKGSLNLHKMMQIMDTTIDQGGATDPDGTIYQIIAVPRELTMWLKASGHFDWQKIDLRELFAR